MHRARDVRLYGGSKEAASFLKLIELMIAPTNDVEGCECIFPDSVFFGEDGKPMFVARSDARGRMVAVTNRLGLQEIRQKFSA